MIIEVSDIHRNDYKYFAELNKSIEENIESIRYYFYKYEYEDNLNSIRPITKAEENMLELNKNSVELFCEEYIFGGETYSEKRKLENVYSSYRYFCSERSFKIIDIRYFTQELKKLGFNTTRKRQGGPKITFVIGGEIYNNDENVNNNEEDKDTRSNASEL